MAYTVTKLITNAYYLSGIVSREFQTVSGSQFSDGLDLLNDILGDKATDAGMIPYRSNVSIPTVVGQEEYFVENAIKIDTVTFELDSVRYAMNQVSSDHYFGSSRANDIESLPYNYHFERAFGGGNLYLYFKPNKVYPLEIWGIFRLANVVQNQDLELTLDRFYIAYLKYALAERICVEFNYDVPPGLSKQLAAYELKINNNSAPQDMTLRKKSTLDETQQDPNYAIVNFGGWIPG